MAVLYVTEYSKQGFDNFFRNVAINAAMEPPVANQVVAIGGGSTQSSAFNANTWIVRIHTDAICSIEFGTNPSATTTTRRMGAGATEYFAVPVGLSYKVAVITNT